MRPFWRRKMSKNILAAYAHRWLAVIIPGIVSAFSMLVLFWNTVAEKAGTEHTHRELQLLNAPP